MYIIYVLKAKERNEVDGNETQKLERQNFWQQTKHLKLYSNLFHVEKRELLTALESQHRGSPQYPTTWMFFKDGHSKR